MILSKCLPEAVVMFSLGLEVCNAKDFSLDLPPHLLISFILSYLQHTMRKDQGLVRTSVPQDIILPLIICFV